MSRRDFSDTVIARIDKDRRSGAAKARDAAVTAHAYDVTQVQILAVAANDRVRHIEGILDACRDRLTAELDAAGASSIIAAKAQQAIIHGATARARAEQAFSTLKPSNDPYGDSQ